MTVRIRMRTLLKSRLQLAREKFDSQEYEIAEKLDAGCLLIKGRLAGEEKLIYSRLATINRKMGRLAEALAYVKKTKIAGDSIGIKFELAEIFASAGDINYARQIYSSLASDTLNIAERMSRLKMAALQPFNTLDMRPTMDYEVTKSQFRKRSLAIHPDKHHTASDLENCPFLSYACDLIQ